MPGQRFERSPRRGYHGGDSESDLNFRKPERTRPDLKGPGMAWPGFNWGGCQWRLAWPGVIIQPCCNNPASRQAAGLIKGYFSLEQSKSA